MLLRFMLYLYSVTVPLVLRASPPKPLCTPHRTNSSIDFVTVLQQPSRGAYDSFVSETYPYPLSSVDLPLFAAFAGGARAPGNQVAQAEKAWQW